MTPPAREPLSRTLSYALLALALALYLLLSAPALFALGIPYDAPAGAFPAKIHPGSYVLLAAYAIGLASHGNPLRVAAGQLRRDPLLAVYAGCMGFVFCWAAALHGTGGLAFIVDTLWMPALAAFTVSLHGARRRRRLVVGVLLLLGLNAVLALGEAGLGQRLIPLRASDDEVVAEAHFRASALLGHPLLNALVTVTLLPALSLLPWRLRWRLLLTALLGLALLAFGGRAALVGAAGLALLAAAAAIRRALVGRCSYLQLTGGLLAATAGVAALAAVVAATGLGERVFANLTWDQSANVRLRVWELLEHVRDTDLWFGMPVAAIDHIAERGGLDLRYEAIENFWLYLLMLFGVIGFVPFVAGIAALALQLWRLGTAPMRAAVVVFFVIASGANTLASKSVSLLLLTAVVHGAARRGLPPAARASRRAFRLPTHLHPTERHA